MSIQLETKLNEFLTSNKDITAIKNLFKHKGRKYNILCYCILYYNKHEDKDLLTKIKNILSILHEKKVIANYINLQDNQRKETLLHLAARANNIKIVTLLLDYDADPLLKTIQGKRASDLTNDNEIRTILKSAERNFMLSKYKYYLLFAGLATLGVIGYMLRNTLSNQFSNLFSSSSSLYTTTEQ
jgi:ankyrin repeat protein